MALLTKLIEELSAGSGLRIGRLSWTFSGDSGDRSACEYDFALRGRASVGPDGLGVTTAEVFDRAGFVGTSAQTIQVQRR